MRLAERSQSTLQPSDVLYVKKLGQRLIGINSVVATIVIVVFIGMLTWIIALRSADYGQNIFKYSLGIGFVSGIGAGIYWSLRILDIRQERLGRPVSVAGIIPGCLAVVGALLGYLSLPIGFSLSLVSIASSNIDLSAYLISLSSIFVGISTIASVIFALSFSYLLMRRNEAFLKLILNALSTSQILDDQSESTESLSVTPILLLGLIAIGVAFGIATGLVFSVAGLLTELLLLIAGYTVGSILAGIFLGMNSIGEGKQFTGGVYVVTAFGCSLLFLPLGMPWNIVVSIVLTLFVASQLGSTINKYIFLPLIELIIRAFLTLNSVWPFRTKQFLNYVTDALILERSGQNYAFAHRLLRDHFVQREMQANQTGNPYWRGQVFLEIRDYKNALAEFDRAIKLAPQNKAFIARRGETYLLLGSMESALSDFNQVINSDAGKNSSGDIPNLLNRAWIHIQLNDLQEASSDVERAIKIDPKNQQALSMNEEIKSLGSKSAPSDPPNFSTQA